MSNSNIDHGGKKTLVEQGTHFKGSFSSSCPVEVRGVVEGEACSGTGFGFCSYAYARPEATLSLVTVGDADDPVVSSYDPRCRSERDDPVRR